MHTVHQSFIRGDVHHVEMAERDELGRQVGGFVVVDIPVSPALRAAIDADYAAGAAGDSFWMVVSGRVGVLPDTGVTAAQGYLLTTSSTTAGLVAQAASAPAAATHFKECGHFINTGSGAGAITNAIVHFN